MKRLIVKYRESNRYEYINVTCERVEYANGIALAFCGGELIGAFDVGRMDMLYVVAPKEAQSCCNT